MAGEKRMVQYIAVYRAVNLALRDLDAFEALCDAEAIGDYDAAVIDMHDGKPHVVRRVDHPRVRVVPQLLGAGPLSLDELHEAAKQLPGDEAGLILVGDATVETVWDRAVTRASKVVKHDFDVAAAEIARDLHDAIAS